MTALQISQVNAPLPLKVMPTSATRLDHHRIDQRQKKMLTYKLIAGQLDLDRRSAQQSLANHSLDQQLERLNQKARQATAQGHHLKADIHHNGMHISIDNAPALDRKQQTTRQAPSVQAWQTLVLGLGVVFISSVVLLALS